MKFKMQDLMTVEQLENKPAYIKAEFLTIDDIKVDFGGQYADVVGLGADIYCALVTDVIEEDFLDQLIVEKCEWLKILKGFESYALIDVSIDETSNIKANINGRPIQLAAAYYKFLSEFTERNNISIKEYHKFLKYNYNRWKKSNKKRIYDEKVKRG